MSFDLSRRTRPALRSDSAPAHPTELDPDDPGWPEVVGRLLAAEGPSPASAALEIALPRLLDRGEAGPLLLVLERLDAPEELLDLVRSRLHLRAGALDRAIALATRALEGSADRSGPSRRAAHLRENLRWIATVAGDPDLLAGAADPPGAMRPSGTIRPPDPRLRPSDDLVELQGRLAARLAEAPPTPSALRGALLARLAAVAATRGDGETALGSAIGAVDELVATGSPREVALARLTAADALVLLGRPSEATPWVDAVSRDVAGDLAVIAGLVDHEERNGDPVEAARWRRELVRARREAAGSEATDGGGSTGDAVHDEPLDAIGLDPGLVLRTTARAALAAVAAGAGHAPASVTSLATLARRVGAERWLRLARLLAACLEDGMVASDAVRGADPASLATAAPALVPLLDALTPDALATLRAEMGRRPERWRPCLRAALAGDPPDLNREAALALLEVGTADDVPLLAAVSRAARNRNGLDRLGKRLARRVAAPIFIDDLGRVGLAVTGTGAGIAARPKVLALLCFLLTTEALSATRDQVLDALWPESDPDTAGNSLNQTIYFLRRAFERPYRDEHSPDYVHHETDVVWLDRGLVESRSRRCRELVARTRGGAEREPVDELVATYTGRFALDFAYEPWADPYREALHAGYLATIEGAVRIALAGGEPDRAIALARRALEIDPGAEPLERELLRAYRLVGSPAAAAEQYGHYAAMLRDDLGVDPPPLDAI